MLTIREKEELFGQIAVQSAFVMTSDRAIFDVFRERGWDPKGGKVYDSTDWISWSSRTDELLEALFPLDP